MSGIRIVTEPLGGSALAQAVLAGRLGAEFGVAVPRGREGWKERACGVGAAASTWLDPIRDAFGSTGAALERLTRTASAKGVVVTTGQQPGLFGGPVYTWSKAISALALADAIERETGTPAAPVFWAATDDADFDEARGTEVLMDHATEALALAVAPPPGTPMATAPLGATAPLVERLRQACGSMAYAEAFDAARRAYSDEQTVGGAYLALLRALLGPLGIAVLDASHPSVRLAGARTLRGALERAGEVERALALRGDAIEALGFTPQVSDVAGLSTVFVYERGLKRRVKVGEAAALARTADPEALGPNVLLRPVLERAVLPTVAYVAGPGELAYFAQVSAVADALGAERPLAVPRWSCTLVEPAVDRALSRLGVAPDDLRDAEPLVRRVALDSVPPASRDALLELRAAFESGLAALRAADAQTPGGPLVSGEVMAGAGRQLEFRLDRLERRLVAAAKRREGDGLRDVRLARASLWPHGQRQERTLNFVPFLARYGPALWDGMRAAASAHAAAVLEGGARGA